MAGWRKMVMLSNESINAVVEEAEKEYLRLAGKKAGSLTEFKLSVEELLLKCQQAYGVAAKCVVSLRRQLSVVRFEVKQTGPAINPLTAELEMEDEEMFSFDILQRLGIIPKYDYINRRTCNRLTLVVTLKQQKSGLLKKMLLAVLAAVVAYGLLLLVPEDIRQMIYQDILMTVFTKLTAVISGIATVLVFFSVIVGMLGCSDIRSFGKMGKELLKEMGLSYAIVWVVLTVGSCLVYMGGSIAAGAEEGIIRQLLVLVLDVAPSNLVEPFVTNNALQVITISIFVGIVLLILGNRAETVKTFCMEASELVNKMMTIVCKTLPLVVFLGILCMLASGAAKQFLSIYVMVIMFFVICAVFITGLTIRAHILTKTPIRVLMKKQLEAFLITLTTSSQVAAIPANMHCFKNRFGIKSDLADFSLPLCVVAYMPCGAVFLGLTAIALGSLAGMPMTFAVILKATVVAVIVAIAAPPIPGSALAVMPIIFSVCNVPDAQYPVALVLGTVLGYLLPALNCYCLQLKILIVANNLNMADKNVLQNPDI